MAQNNFRTIKALLKQLETYGLNPRDWRIERDSLDSRLERIEMRHRQDADFRLRGSLSRTQTGRPIVAHMTLISM